MTQQKGKAYRSAREILSKYDKDDVINFKLDYGSIDRAVYNSETVILAMEEYATQEKDRQEGWISVKDSFPEDGQKVNFLLKDGDVRFGTFNVNGIWGHRNVFNGDGFLTVEWVTHWMPLPNPPHNQQSK
jgi:hypothetical protein